MENLSPRKRSNYHGSRPEGVVITSVHGQSHLGRIGARPGDIIRQIDDFTIKNTKDFEKAVVKYRIKTSVVMLLQREGQLYYITVRLG